MADDETLKIKVELDAAQSKSELKGEADGFREVGKTADQVYKSATKASQDSAAKRDAFGRSVARSEKDSLGQVAQAHKQNADVAVKSMSEIASAAGPLLKRFGELAAAGKLISVAVDGYRGLTGAMSEAVKYGEKQVDQLIQLKNDLRDIASMTNSAGGSSDRFVQSFLDIRKASGLNTEGAKGFIQGFAGSGEAKKGVTITPEEYERAKPMLARYAAANSRGTGVDVEAFGNLAGLEMGFHPNNKAEDVLGNVAAVNDILKLGVGDNPTLIRQFSEQAGSLLNSQGGGYGGSDKSLAALISVASIQRSAGKSGTTVEQAARALRGFGDSQKDALANAGITDKDTIITSLYKMFDQIKAAEGRGVTPDTFLSQSGFASDEERASIAALYQGREYLTKFLEEGKNAKTPKEVQAELNASFRSSEGLQANVAQAKLDEAEAHNASLRQHIKPLQLEAQARLTAQGVGLDSEAAVAADELVGRLRTANGVIPLPEGMSYRQLGRKAREEQEMFKILQEQGIEVPNRIAPSDPRYNNFLTAGGMQDAYAEATATQYLEKQVGGARKPARKIGPEVQDSSADGELARTLIQTSLADGGAQRLLQKISDKLDPAPIPVARPQGVARGDVIGR